MNKIEDKFSIDANAKKNALKLFPDFFGKDLCVSSRFKLKDLETQYLNYCIKYFTNYSYKGIRERKDIQTAYEYLKTILTNQVKIKINSKLSTEILNSYENLILTISNYHFIPHRKGSYGDKQNENNKRLLFEISLLTPVLYSILKNIDLYLENILEPEKVDDFYCMLIYRLNSMIKSLNTINNDLKKSQQRYYNTWNLVNRPGYDQQPSSYTNLGYAKKEWRLTRNKAVRTILDFYDELESLNIALYYGTFQFHKENYGLDQATLEISQNYNNGIKNIINGPNYFCYLDSEEKQEIAIQKFLKRTKELK